VFVGPELTGLPLRKTTQVAFPAGKVHLFEEFDWGQDEPHYFAYPDANCNVLMFDGSAGKRLTQDSNFGWDPGQQSEPCGFRSKYVQIAAEFPAPVDGESPEGLSEQSLPRWYMWTRGGLQGIDYGGGSIAVGDGFEISSERNLSPSDCID